MAKQLGYYAATYGPQEQKTFAGALGAFFQHECPQLGGERTRRVLVQSIIEMIGRFYPEKNHMRPGQIQWTTVHKDAKASYGKKTKDTPLTSVVLDLVRGEDVKERREGKRLREMKKEAVARIFTQSYAQGGCMTNAELAILLKLSPSTVSKYAREWEAEKEELLPRRGTIHDMGPTLTHKKRIIEKLYLEGKPVRQVQRETHHSPEAIHRYITAFKQVILCQQKGLTPEQTAFATNMCLRLVQEYHALICQLASRSPGLEALLETDSSSS